VTIPGYSALSSLAAPTRYYPARVVSAGPSLTVGVVAQFRRLGSLTGGISVGQLFAGRAGFQCSGFECTCRGDEDCNDLYSTGLCGDIGVCDEDGCRCLRI
jgi:hypothetical protein